MSSLEDFLVRPIARSDLDLLLELASSLGPGMTTLPADRQFLDAKIDRSIGSFIGKSALADSEYVLVLEDLPSGRVVGTAGVYPRIGAQHGFFSYKRIRLLHRSSEIDVTANVELLAVANDYTDATEVGGLAIHPGLKGTGAGRMLARSRYLLIATDQDRFSPTVMAEMRGWQDRDGRSPFWEAVGGRFFNMDFASADRLSAVAGAKFIADLLPKHPVYVSLLPEDARQAIGRPHPDSAPAMAMLGQEGFRYDGYVDVFDAGPQVHVERDGIATLRNSRSGAPAGLASDDRTEPMLVCTDEFASFRMICAAARVEGDRISLDPSSERRLGCPGAKVRAVAAATPRQETLADAPAVSN